MKKKDKGSGENGSGLVIAHYQTLKATLGKKKTPKNKRISEIHKKRWAGIPLTEEEKSELGKYMQSFRVYKKKEGKPNGLYDPRPLE